MTDRQASTPAEDAYHYAVGTYAIPRWLVWLMLPQIAFHAVIGIALIVGWLGG